MENAKASLKEIKELIAKDLHENPFLQGDEAKNRYIKALQDEILEVDAELKKDNVVYLQDELADIFWNYMVLLSILERDSYIDSVDSVLLGAKEKFKERIDSLYDSKLDFKDAWDEVKKKQKVRLKKAHEVRYS